jgi:hypothetical protein
MVTNRKRKEIIAELIENARKDHWGQKERLPMSRIRNYETAPSVAEFYDIL